MNDTPPLDRRFLLGGLAGAAGISALAAMAKGGPLTPPSGTVAATGKTLTDVEPRIAINNTNTPGDADSLYRIAQAGSYYLTANMLVASGKNGIKIAASGVTLDLNGFQIAGFGGLGGIIPSSTAVERINIRNGSITTLPYAILFTDVPDVTVENVRIENITGYGIRAGERSIVRGCTVINAGVSGASYGIRVDDHSLIEDCTIADTTLVGLSAGTSSRVNRCTVTGSTNQGMVVSGTVTNCVARGNGGGGIQVQEGAVIGCLAFGNSGTGIRADGSMVIDCFSSLNDYGIVLGERGVVRGCVSTLNNDSGIHVNYYANRVESNTCIENTIGIFVVLANGRNIITGNTCIDSRTTAYNIAAGNVCQVIAAATTGAINGSSGGASPGSTSAWANFAL